jgi:hypothetical protein
VNPWRLSVGDEVILAQPIFSAAHPSQLVGHGWVAVTLVGASVSQDHATLVLKEGQIDAAGIQASNPFQLAVTGGYPAGSRTPAGRRPSGFCAAPATRR